MTTCIALFRGVNVGGNSTLPMKELVVLLENLGAKQVRTYIQSGNVLFQCANKQPAQLAPSWAAEIKKRYGFEPHILILTLDMLHKAIANNPFPEAEADPSTLHLGFLAAVPKSPDLAKLESLRAETEHFRLIDSVFYLHAPLGVGRSRLAAGSEKCLGVPMTDRNWRTVCKLKELALA